MSSAVTISEKFVEVSGKLNQQVLAVIGSDQVIGFEKAYITASAIRELKSLLTKEYMTPIMSLQGSRLGFKTDMDAKGGYPEEVVKSCLIDAVLIGLQPVGNQFNIIAGNMYPTREGLTELLRQVSGLTYEVVPQLPRINADKSSAAIIMSISWTINGETKNRDIEIPIKMNSYMGTDAVIGKAHRKARMWLFNTIKGTDLTDGDVMDTERRKSNTIDISHEEIRQEEVIKQIEENLLTCHSLDDLDILMSSLDDELQVIMVERFEARKTEIENQ